MAKDGLCECGCGGETSIATRTDTAKGHVKDQPKRFLRGHQSRWPPGKEYDVVPGPLETPCWIWKNEPATGGYGHVTRDGVRTMAHRFIYEREVGPIPDGLTLDHLCRVLRCVNPRHLDPVPQKTNVLRGEGVAAKHARQTHCLHGHPLSGDNLYVPPRGGRECRTCKDRHDRKRRAP